MKKHLRTAHFAVLVVAVAVAVAAAALLFGWASSAWAQEEAQAETATVVEIQVSGNDHLKAKEITAALPFEEGGKITLPDDLVRAENALKELGLLQDVSVDYRRSGDGIAVLITVEENPVIDEIEFTGNRDWNELRRLTIPLIGLSLRWPFTDYLVEPDRLFEILKEDGIEKGKVLNVVKLRKALGIGENGACLPNPPRPSICGEYRSKGYFLFAIGDVQVGEKLRIQLIEYVIEGAEVRGVEGPAKAEAEKILGALPRSRPTKLQQVQLALQAISQSVYFEPLRPEDVTFAPGSAPDRVKLVVTLKERRLIDEPVEIERIEFEGNTAFSDAELQSRVKLPEGPVDNYKLLAALEGVYRLYRKNGFMMVKFVRERLEDGLLVLRVDEGRIGEIEIRQNGYVTARLTTGGLERVPLEGQEVSERGAAAKAASGKSAEQNWLIRRLEELSDFLGQFLGTTLEGSLPRTQPEIIVKELSLRPGELVNQFRLADSYRQLLGLGYFKTVNFDFQPLDSGEIKLVVDVTEQDKLGSIQGGFSLSPDGLVGQLSVNGKNLYGLGQDLSLKLDRGLLGKAVVNWNLEYRNRTLLRNADYVLVKLFRNTSKEKRPKPHLLERIGGEASLAYPLGDLQVVLGLRHEAFAKDFEGGEEPTVERGLTNSLSVTVNEDTRNNPIFATRGGSRSFRLEKAGLFYGTTEFTKLSTTLIQHFPTLEDQTIALRFVGALGVDLPSQEEFQLGGSTTLRGIKTMRTPAMAFLNLEYRIQFLPGTFSIALFADMGTGSPFDLKKSIGIEGRINVPYVGPIRLAFAWPITDRIEYFKVEYGFGSFF